MKTRGTPSAPAAVPAGLRYDEAVLASLPLLCSALGLLYLVRVAPYAWTYTGDTRHLLVGLEVAVAAIFLLVGWLAYSGRLPATRWEATAGAIIVMIGVETPTRVHITGEAWQCMDLMLAVVSAAATMSSRLWFGLGLAACWGSGVFTFATAVLIGGADPAALIWPYMLLAMMSGSALAVIFRSSRLGTFDSLVEARRAAELVSVRDALTGLTNRRGLELAFHQLLPAADGRGEPLHCLFIDVDSFKSVNDTVGHALGDEVLTSVADALVACSPENAVVCRWAGDEFVVLVVGAGIDAEELERRVAERLQATSPLVPTVWRGLVSAGGTVREVGASADLDVLLRAADEDMYDRRAVRRRPSRDRAASSA